MIVTCRLSLFIKRALYKTIFINRTRNAERNEVKLIHFINLTLNSLEMLNYLLNNTITKIKTTKRTTNIKTRPPSMNLKYRSKILSRSTVVSLASSRRLILLSVSFLKCSKFLLIFICKVANRTIFSFNKT